MTLELPNLGRDPVAVGFAGLLGALIGSFLNVCILRWGAEPKQSVVRPPSRCPTCGRGLAWHENVPIVGWLVLRGRCSGCRLPISPQYPLVELATALLWAAMAWRYGFGLEGLRAAAFVTLLLGIAMTDARAYVIPHEFSLGGAAIALGFAAVSGAELPGVREALVGAAFGAGLVLLIGEVSELAAGQEAMGGGDCALMGLVGAFSGWEAIIPVVGAGAAVSVVLYVVAAVRGRRVAPIAAGPGAESRSNASERLLGPDTVPAPDESPVPDPLLVPDGLPPVPAPVGDTRPSLRLGMLLKLLAGGMVALAAMVAAMRLGVFGAVLRAGFDGVIAAGVVYYASFVLPAALEGRWVRIVGLLAAAVGIAVGGTIGAGAAPGVTLGRLASGVLVAVLSLSLARRVTVADSPDTVEGLSAGGYLPFGVGLSIAAGVLALLAAYPDIRAAVAAYLQLAGAS